LNTDVRRTAPQNLGVGIRCNQLDTFKANFNHAINGIAPGAAHAQDFNNGMLLIDFCRKLNTH
jgi:hypothetical protein